MAIEIAWKLSVDIPSGPGLTMSSVVDVEAYDRIAVKVPNSTASPPAEAAVDVQPGAAGKVRFLLVRSDAYGDDLTFKVHDTANPARALNDALLLVGEGSLSLLESPLDKLLVTNTLGRDVTIEILVGRLAT